MISTHECALFCADIYGAPRAPWDHLWTLDDVVVGHKVVDGQDVIALRGSLTAGDWIRDAEGWPEWHDQIGFCHAGFLAGMDDVFAEVKAACTLPMVIAGHSLGGARARILAAMLAVNHDCPAKVCTFGSPKPGFGNIARVIQKSGMLHESYRNRNDPVPLVPGILPMWEHPEPWVALNEPADADNLDPLRDHAIVLYIEGVSKL